MRKRYRLSRRHRALWIGAVVFCLLFQQLAMASYVCALSAPSATTLMTGDCADMGMSSGHQTSEHQRSDPRCAEHCADHATATPDARLPGVPPLLLAPVPPALLGTVAAVPEQAALPDPTMRRAEPPPTLRFCSLLI